MSTGTTDRPDSSLHLPGAGAEDSGPVSSGDLSVEWRGLRPVPPTVRYGHPRELFAFWFAMQLFPVAFFIGALGAESFIGLSLWQGIIAIIIGNILASVVVAGLSIMGPRTGAAQLPLARAPFGSAVVLVGVLAYIISLVFLALGAVYGAQALQVVISALPFAIALIIVFGLEATISIVGYALLHRYERITAILAGLGFLAVAIEVLLNAGKIHVPQTAHGGAAVGSFVLLTAIAFSFGIGWAPNAADYCRYLPENTPARQIFTSVFGGLALGCVLIEVLGLAAATLLASNVSQMKGLFDLMNGGVLGYAVMIAIYIGVVANIAATDYSAGLQILSTGLRIPRPIMTGISAIIAFALTLWLQNGNLVTQASNLILVVTYWVGPFVAIVAIHWWRNSVAEHVAAVETPVEKLHFGWRALVALVIGFVVSLPFSDTTEGATLAAHGGILKTTFGSVSNNMYGADLAYLVGALVAGAIYFALVWNERSVAGPAVTPASARE